MGVEGILVAVLDLADFGVKVGGKTRGTGIASDCR